MTKILATIPAFLLIAACASNGTGGAGFTTTAANGAQGGQGAEWQTRRQQYLDCAKDKADAGLSNGGTTKSIVASALQACRGELEAVRTSFRTYMDSEMVSAHGHSGARDAANRMGHDAENKVRVYLMSYVDSQQRNATARR